MNLTFIKGIVHLVNYSPSWRYKTVRFSLIFVLKSFLSHHWQIRN